VGTDDALGETILCALVAREWRWRGRSVAEVALGPSGGPQRWRLRTSACGVWMTDEQVARTLRMLEERVRAGERAVRALAAAQEAREPRPRVIAPMPGSVAFAREAYASALARWRSGEHAECLRAQARLLEAHIALPHCEDRADLRIAALRRRWEAAERSERASAEVRALAFARLVQAASAAEDPVIRIRRTQTQPA
jgi:hypothetical protein